MPRGALQCGRGCVSCAPSCRASWRRAAMPCHPACCVWLRTWPQTGDARIEELSGEIDTLARQDQACVRLMTKPGIGPIISSAMVAAFVQRKGGINECASRFTRSLGRGRN
jgi:diadenosine tetraphosphatase ApaH/serine/threonine PP2A family protein phosphatase